MASEKLSLTSYIKHSKPSTKKKKKKAKSPKAKKTIFKRKGGIANAWYTASNVEADSGGSAISEGETLISELFSDIKPFTVNPNPGMSRYASEDPAEEEPEMKASKVDQARQLFQAMFNRPDAARTDIINSFMQDVGVTNSTAVSYYTRFLDEFGVKSKEDDVELGQGVDMKSADPISQGKVGDEEGVGIADDMEGEEDPSGDPDRAGIIRTVNNAHLIYKRQTETGTFDELWIFNIHDNSHDELDIRRDILAATDIPMKKTKSADGQQSYVLTTMGNAQLIRITGLPN